MPDIPPVASVAAATAPPRDAHLVEATWPETAAWIARAAAEGRPVIVNFFASWCAPCRREAPLLLAARDANPGVAFLGVAYRDRAEDAERFMAEAGFDLPTLLDFDGSVGAEMSLRGMPTTYAFGPDGRVAAVHPGELLDGDLDDLLAAART